MQPIFNSQAPKKAANLSVNADLLSRARELNINLSATLEQALIQALEQRRREEWLVRNRDAIDAYNEHVEAHGVFSAGIRSF
ncbi:MAG: type II toxin-antitoxin system CcdA family antitoxin [Gammaproteobacteria bacterium]|nr:type II toxin-antitoxin system CcdA family antitoxin [Gammaproteobacteria bacterium]